MAAHVENSNICVKSTVPLGCSATRKHFHTSSICILHLNGLAALELELQAVKLICLLGHLGAVFLTAGD